jgi:DNA-damage-inducible protein J
MNPEKSTKGATVRARIEPVLKQRAEKILNGMGISATQAVNMLYKRVIKERGWPCELREPNEETIAVFEATDKGEGLVSFDNIEDMIESLHNEAQAEEETKRKSTRG